MEKKYLVFDNLNFKICVIAELEGIFEFDKTFKPRNVDNSTSEDYEDEQNGKVIGVENLEGYDCDVNLNAMQFYQELQIPIEYADEIETICQSNTFDMQSEELTSYDVNLGPWDGEVDYFYIDKLSLREIKQFKNLTEISILAEDENIESIQEMIDDAGLDIEVNSVY